MMSLEIVTDKVFSIICYFSYLNPPRLIRNFVITNGHDMIVDMIRVNDVLSAQDDTQCKTRCSSDSVTKQLIAVNTESEIDS